MKLTLSWLEEFVSLPTRDPSALVEVFESLGHEVEDHHVVDPAFTGIVVGRVLEVMPHPNADKIRLTRVDVGSEELEIICGAWNFEAGAVVPVAVPGAVLGDDFEITRRSIRGVTSNGMICSEIELGLGTEADGIMVLNEDYPDSLANIGASFADVIGLPDVWFEVNVTPNRPDCLSVYGLARDLAAYFDVPLRDHGISVKGEGELSDISVSIEVPDLNPRFAGREVSGIIVGPSPHWIRWRLEQAGVRPISNVVDASNYAMIEFGHPTHAFDVDRLGNRIVTRLATEGERIVTLDDQERVLTSTDIVVTDGASPVAIGGVMGGAATEVSDDTSTVFIEAAYWDPPSVLATSKRLGLRSEASARFERGADPMFCHLGADRVAQLLEEIAGGTAAPNAVDVDPGGIEPWTIRYATSETARILGIEVDAGTTTELLSRLGFGVEGGDPLEVTVPTRRSDVRRPVDLVEEIARLHGFDKVPDRVPQGPGLGLPVRDRKLRLLRDVMTGAGFSEVLTFSFIGESDLDKLAYGEGHVVRDGIRVVNPLNESEGVMRTTLLPGVLKSAGANLARRIPSAHLFEIGRVFLKGAGKLPEQPDRIAFAMAGQPLDTWIEESRQPDVFDAVGVWEMIADKFGIRDASIRPAAIESFHPGRSGEVMIGDVAIGAIGELHPSVASAFGLSGRVAAAEFDLDALLTDRGAWQFDPPSVFPPVVFDLAFAMEARVPAGEVIAAAVEGAGDMLETYRVFDVFEGSSIGEGQKSIAISFVLRSPDKTLTDEEAAPIRKRIAATVQTVTGAMVRGDV